MLNITDSILLLLENEDGVFLPTQSDTVKSVLVGAVLIDLSLAGRIDTDLESLIVLSETSTDNALMDEVLKRLARHSKTADTQHWIEALASDQTLSIPELALANLEQNQIIERKERKLLWFLRSRIYPTVDFDSKENVKLRMREVVLSNDVPDPTEAATACLVEACGLFPEIFSESELRQCRSRMQHLRPLDLIGRAVISRIAKIERQQILAARAKTARLQKLVLLLSVVGALAAAVTLLSPRIPIPDQFGPTLLELLWNDSTWQQWSGYILLGISLVGLMIIAALKNRLLNRFWNYSNWQLAHVALGLLCILILFTHTGFRLGDNLNALLMLFYLATLILGALTGIVISGVTQLRKKGVTLTRRMRVIPIRTHIAALLPLPALLVAHILIVYLY